MAFPGSLIKSSSPWTSFHELTAAAVARQIMNAVMSIERYICSRSSRFMRVFSPYTPEALWKIILKIYSILKISGKFNVRGSLRFQCRYAHGHNKK